MQSTAKARTLCSILAITLVACGSGESGTGVDSGAHAGAALDSGAVACDAGNVGDLGRRCSLSMPVQGGLAGTLNGEQGCGDGSSKGTGAFLAWNSTSLGGRVSAYFENGLPNQPGTFPLTSLNVRSTGANGGAESWTTPSGACTLSVSAVDIECQSVFQQLLHVVHGTGTCSQPAAPDSGTSAGPVTIGDFEFVHWL
jgi:hypothetical protein